jgi:signal transduction histidine kinase
MVVDSLVVLLPGICDRFSRADASRSEGEHVGVGLALVRGFREMLNLSASAANRPEGSVSFQIARR